MKPELLAPCGDLETLQTAIKYGADAVYLGGPMMQMRASHVGFTWETLEEASKLIHDAGRKMYVTVNIFPNNLEIPMLGDYTRRLKDLGADALIVSDIGAIAEIKEKNPDIEIHLSTQANCMNYKAASVYYNMGVKRIVLARELSIAQIAELRKNIPDDMQLEAFIHGAMCMSYSGRCMISAYTTGRSANRGQCAQSCRWKYALVEEKRPGEYFPVEETENGMEILSSKELCCVGLLDELEAAGVCSFKIEGRMRTPYYVGTVVNAYRMLIDKKISADEAFAEVDTASHRPFCTGFYTGNPSETTHGSDGYVRGSLFIATAAEDSKDGKVVIETRNAFNLGDEIEVVTPGMLGRKYKVESIVTEDGESIERSNTPMKKLTINAIDGIKKSDIFRMKLKETENC
ncbi:MAG: U32 family peptidase [Clostridia bacterium]|nr:U32 family peptidase [Clostridia bacterium]